MAILLGDRHAYPWGTLTEPNDALHFTHFILGCDYCRSCEAYELKDGFRLVAVQCPRCGEWMAYIDPFEADRRREANQEIFP